MPDESPESVALQTEEEFCAKYERNHVAQRVARDLYRALHPQGMHTNGPTLMVIEASHAYRLLSRWELPPVRDSK